MSVVQCKAGGGGAGARVRAGGRARAGARARRRRRRRKPGERARQLLARSAPLHARPAQLSPDPHNS